jgi:hypothetical protein
MDDNPRTRGAAFSTSSRLLVEICIFVIIIIIFIIYIWADRRSALKEWTFPGKWCITPLMPNDGVLYPMSLVVTNEGKNWRSFLLYPDGAIEELLISPPKIKSTDRAQKKTTFDLGTFSISVFKSADRETEFHGLLADEYIGIRENKFDQDLFTDLKSEEPLTDF